VDTCWDQDVDTEVAPVYQVAESVADDQAVVLDVVLAPVYQVAVSDADDQVAV